MQRQISRSYSPIEESETYGESETYDEAVSPVCQSKLNRTHITQFNLHQLQPGDHVAWARPYAIYHHGIVADTSNIDQGNITVFHYNSVSKKIGRKVKIIHEEIYLDKQKGEMFKFHYAPECTKQNPASKVLERAASLEGERGYQFLTNNCEHFATLCKTGSKQCTQTKWLSMQAIRTAAETLTSDITCGGARVGMDVVATKAAYYSGNVALSEGVEKVVKGTNVIGAGIVVALEVAHCVYDIYKMHKEYKEKEKKMEKSDFKAEVTERVVKGTLGALCTIGASLGGQKLGMIIGSGFGTIIPGIGTMVGGFLGAVLAGLFGNIVGKWLGLVFGRLLGNRLFRKEKNEIK